jgi:hypothetical protein
LGTHLVRGRDQSEGIIEAAEADMITQTHVDYNMCNIRSTHCTISHYALLSSLKFFFFIFLLLLQVMSRLDEEKASLLQQQTEEDDDDEDYPRFDNEFIRK